MKNRKAMLLSAGLAGVMLFMFAYDGRAELSIEETRKLLQESLTISEIDREIERLSAEEVLVGDEIVSTEAAIVTNSEIVKQTREHAGRVLRSYYMGNRNSLWLLLLRADSFADALTVFQYLQAIAESDQHALDRYRASYDELKRLQTDLADRQTKLGELKQAFVAQRERLVQLQAELDRQLAAVDDKDALITEMEKLNAAWRQDGLPLFRSFLDAMSKAMLNLDEYLTENEDAMTQTARKAFLFHVEEEPLNAFLRKQDPLFERFIYTLTEQHIAINGHNEDVRIGVEGHFQIEKEPEEALRFMLDELTYNGYTLPDTTRLEMQQQFSMTFYPERNPLTALLQIASVEMKTGEFSIGLTLP